VKIAIALTDWLPDADVMPHYNSIAWFYQGQAAYSKHYTGKSNAEIL
jgi:hypothetical protein